KGIGGDVAVAAHLRLQIEVVGRRDPAPGVLGNGAIDALQLAGVGIGQRAQQHFIDDAERRRVGADAESERHDGNEDEAGRATQRPEGESKIVHGIQLRRPFSRYRASSAGAAHRDAWQGFGPRSALSMPAAACPLLKPNVPESGTRVSVSAARKPIACYARASWGSADWRVRPARLATAATSSAGRTGLAS